jgi:putative acetyltransferase
VKRIFVDPAARGTGAGRGLTLGAIEQARADGYDRLCLDTFATLTEAIALYERLGFSPCPPFYDPDPELSGKLRFFDISL